jgi:hypothetical protein
MKVEHRIHEPGTLGTCILRLDELWPDLLRKMQPAAVATIRIDTAADSLVPLEQIE